MDKPLVSVVICTYNRADILPYCLNSLTDQSVDKKFYEVLVVDNNSTDQTQQIVSQFEQTQPNIKLLIETRQGANHARNCGCRQASGEYLAFIDDDAKAFPDWISQIISFIQWHPEISVFGGPYEAYSLVNFPPWFPPDYGTYDLGGEERPIRFGLEWLNGTNMIVKKEAFFKVAGFHPNLGILKNGRISYGEETRLLVDLNRAGYIIYNVPQIRVRHLVAEYKMNLIWLLTAHYRLGRCSRETFNRRRPLASHMYGLLRSIIKIILNFFSWERVPIKRRLYYSFRDLFTEIGALVDFIK